MHRINHSLDAIAAERRRLRLQIERQCELGSALSAHCARLSTNIEAERQALLYLMTLFDDPFWRRRLQFDEQQRGRVLRPDCIEGLLERRVKKRGGPTTKC